MCINKNGPKTEVAVILDDEGLTGRLSEPGNVVVYAKNGCSWETARETEFSIDNSKGLSELRQKITELKEFLGGCKIFVAKSASGAMFFELEKSGFSIWEISGRPAEFLDSVIEQEGKNNDSDNQPSLEIPKPLEISSGYFYISIKEIQGRVPGISSKMILQKFISQGNFNALEIICDHIPPWIELDADRKGFRMDAEKKAPNEYLVKLTKT